MDLAFAPERRPSGGGAEQSRVRSLRLTPPRTRRTLFSRVFGLQLPLHHKDVKELQRARNSGAKLVQVELPCKLENCLQFLRKLTDLLHVQGRGASVNSS